jgi:cell wall-associated NlpC family hydrolase
MTGTTTPTTTAHWAARYIGAPYVAGAAGPAAFDCWGLVRAVVALRHGIDLAHSVRPGAARALGWRPVHGPAADGDVVSLRAPDGQRHVGVAVLRGRRLVLLHAIRSRGVCCQPIDELPACGYAHLQPWRPAP